MSSTPKYAHRGFMLDTGRKYFPPSSILQLLDMMKIAGLNIFHWHIYDSQSFPIEWDFEGGKLTNAGCFKDTIGNNLIYTKADIAQIISHANKNGIDVIPEFEMPAHSDIFNLVYPEIMCCNPDPTSPEPSGQFNLINPETQKILSQFFMDTLPQFNSIYTHTGGDEVAFPPTDPNPLQSLTTFENTFIQNILSTYGKTGIVWSDLLLDNGVNLSKKFILQTWRNPKDVNAIIKAGYKTVISTSNVWYIGNATPNKIKKYKFPISPLVLGAELVWFTSPSDDPSDLSWLLPCMQAAGNKLING